MTVEQLAEQYIDNHSAMLVKATKTATDLIEQAYIAGYNEAQNTITQCNRSALSGVKWHKVADGDLPDTDRTVLAVTQIGGNPNYAYLASYREDTELKWACWKNNMQREVVEPIAWCEIPTFTE